MTWMCSICGYTYDGEDFTKEADDYLCPLCDSGKESFQQRDLKSQQQPISILRSRKKNKNLICIQKKVSSLMCYLSV